MTSFKLVALACASIISFSSCGDDNSNGSGVQATASFTVSTESITVDYPATTQTVSVNSTADWNISTTADWITVRPSGGIKNETTNVTVTIAENKTTSDRSAVLTLKAGASTKNISVTQTAPAALSVSPTSTSVGAQGGAVAIAVSTNVAWTASANVNWIHLSAASGNTSATVNATVDASTASAYREGTVTFTYGGSKTATVTIKQLSDNIATPEGYTLVWNDEFNDASLTMPDTKNWTYEVWNPGTVNNELQRYVAGKSGNNVTAEVSNGILKIHAIKVGNEVLSARMNSTASWQYGYMEARIKLPKGKGTWPAFWMMPKNYTSWPKDGEIDIMEEVGYNPGYIVSTIHCNKYNNGGTQIESRSKYVATAESDFHVYACEWTATNLKFYVDGEQILNYANDKTGYDAWPFDQPFYIILNLAWGGDWGGAKGVDESALPATYEIDYVRVFQKK
jgi:beta-glucanase (GH16 family)